jgi:glycosyltransferase involved in cell wall biosynthesis
MTSHADPRAVQRALAQRLRAAAAVLLPDGPGAGDDPAVDAAELLTQLVARVRESAGSDTTWLLLVALSGSFPDDTAVHAAHRRLQLDSASGGMLWLLDMSLARLRAVGAPLVEIEIAENQVVVDVDFSARNDLNTGIQRVVRSTVPRWAHDHDPVLVAWTASGAYRRLTPREEERVLRWSGPLGADRARRAGTPRIVVPWRSVVVLPEVPAPHLCAALASLAEHSGNAVTLIGYDCIPVVSADMMPPVEPNRFVKYLTIVKHARRVSGISASATAEFRGFTHMLPAQGLDGPDVSECSLPVEAPAPPVGSSDPIDPRPLVLVVGSREPRKNHLAVLHAAERLWREGLEFRLRFIGGSSWASSDFDAVAARLRGQGRPVSVGRTVGDDGLWSAFREARFTVFPSLHEGFGLPVAESLAVGTPAVTSNFGSMSEIARNGGALEVDPRDDRALTTAMRQLLTDDELLATLTLAAQTRTPRSWADYADDLWTQLVDDVEVTP